MIKNWRQYFSKVILERGRDYYNDGMVEIISADDRNIEAEVDGSYTYNVEITIDKGEVEDMNCNCPYANDGNYCKHMAAVLFAAEKLSPKQSKKSDWKTALGKLSDEELRELVSEFAQNDRKFRETILRAASIDDHDPAQVKKEVKRLIDSYTDRSGFLDYDAEYDCMIELTEYLNEKSRKLFGKISSSEAAELILIVLESALDVECDDSDGGLTLITDACEEALDNIVFSSSHEVQKAISERIISHIDKKDLKNGAFILEGLLYSLAWDKEITKTLIDRIDRDFTESDIPIRVRLMTRAGMDNNEVISYLEQHSVSDVGYSLLLEIYESNDLSKAVGLVNRRRELKKGDSEKANLTRKLIALYEKLGDKENYKAELTRLVITFQYSNIEYAERLKAVTDPDEWASDTFFRVLSNAHYMWQRLPLYALEGMYDSILMEINEKGTLVDFTGYEKELAEKYPEKSRDLLVKLLDKSMAEANSRDNYRGVIARLKRLNAYPDGKDAARGLAGKWRIQYSSRRAMIDELNKAKY